MSELDTSHLNLSGSRLIEASAGTGKTYTITNLCLRLLLGRGQPPLTLSQILVLTFTNAATDELKERIARRLQEARSAFRHGTDDNFLQELIETSSDPERELKLLTGASQLMDEASIFTIHGFCARVLNERAFESGVLFQQPEEVDQDELLQLAAEDYFRNHVLSLGSDLRDVALGLWPNPLKLAEQLRPLLLQSDMTIYPEAITDFNANQLVIDARAAKQAWLEEDMPALIDREFDGRYTPKKRLKKSESFWRNPAAELTSDIWAVYARESLEKSIKADFPEANALQLIDRVHQDSRQLPGWLWATALTEVRRLIAAYKAEWHLLTVDDLLTLTGAAVSRPGSQLAELLAERWPVALIDEFQDTDPVQYDIFRTIYQAQENRGSLLMIGDPKQAIYQFRGADVFTYLNARQSANEVSTLTTNWRSTPALIEATNHLFQKPRIFGDTAGISFDPVQPAASNSTRQMTIADQTPTPYQLCIAGQETGTMNVDIALGRLMDFAAEEVVRLLDPDSAARINDAPVKAGQIAFLVRRRKDAAAAKAALARRGIRSVYQTQDNVLHQDTARDLKLILDAVAEPTNDRAIRAALATRLLQVTAEEIDALNRDPASQQAVIEEFRSYHDLWRNRQLAVMLNRLMTQRQLAEKWLQQPEGERQLTNFRHLTELLQARATTTPGMFQLIKWFERQLSEADSSDIDARLLRLESDEDLVKIVTMHAAKGLEYDIVMLPMPVFNRRPKGKTPALFHEQQNGRFTTALELGDNELHRSRALQEQRDEEMRLLYVAVTRARYRCYIGLPQIQSFDNSAVASLLGLEASSEFTDLKDRCLSARDTGLLPADLFSQVDVAIPESSAWTDSGVGTTLVEPPTKPVSIDSWRVHSYTSVIARIAEPHITGGYADDDVTLATQAAGDTSRLTFPRGPRVGIALHALLEDVDFMNPTQHLQLCERLCRTLGLAAEWLPVLDKWLGDILTSPLDDHCLQDIARSDRLDEMEFHFSLRSGNELVAWLNDLGYLRSHQLKVSLEGMMTGLIDLLYRRDNRYFIIDYKSNFLGYQRDDYRPERLADVMLDQHYSLQFLIYTVATHRMLQNTLPDYNYEQHFGGIRYLFLRGMDGATDNGIYWHRPDVSLVTELDQRLGADP